MIEETLTDAERQLLIGALTQKYMDTKIDPAMRREITDILSIVTGTDTVLVARRAYPSRAAQSQTK